jgi:hypothetical protein
MPISIANFLSITLHKVFSVLLKHILSKLDFIGGPKAKLLHDGIACKQIVPSCCDIALVVHR